MEHTVLVGGGLTGILYALRLSQTQNLNESPITIIDSNESLGGRFFFTSSGTKERSGYGFEYEDPQNLDTLKRHIFLYLSEDEKSFLDNWVHEKLLKHPFQNKVPKKYFMRKELLNSEYILLSNSEFFTKKDAEFLQSIAQFDLSNIDEVERNGVFSQSKIWKNAHKTMRENTLNLLECTVSRYVLTLPLKQVVEKMHHVFSEQNKPSDPFFLRIAEIEKAFTEILQKRGVTILTKCTLKSFKKENDAYALCVIHETQKTLTCEKLILTIPPFNIRMLIEPENLSRELARFIHKVQPTSLVCLELHNFKDKLIEELESHFLMNNEFYFPVEGSKAYVTSDERLIVSLELDYETSLQAPAVREALTKLRRSVRRILKPEIANEFKKGAFIRKTQAFERIILLSIASSVPYHLEHFELPKLSDTSCKLTNVLMSGDYFHTLGETSWKRIVKSIEANILS